MKNNVKSNKLTFIKFLVIFLFVYCIGFIAGSYIGKHKSIIVGTSYNSTRDNIIKNNNRTEGKKEVTKPIVNPYKSDGRKVAYLTFDDGPSGKLTPKILDILKEYDVKATFFLIGELAKENPEIVKRQKKEGHSICNHTYSHDYNYLYSSVDNFINDVKKCDETIKSILKEKYKSMFIRFPGGSFGDTLNPYKEAIKNNGYKYIDWNALNGDAEAKYVNVDKLIENVKNSCDGKEHVVILMHDAPAKETTVQALPKIIEYLKSEKYNFELLY
ncbi:polysaccharide deacetylase family protein [Clostridium rectalis]|uniref:polysaccharide deacetylase family protein n=1 Tax=Clostridium rectalis TaxID=2040295 RepID=UPI000F630940|nr:polysaccharide deacetylase family protein [Clostridium rectalis]